MHSVLLLASVSLTMRLAHPVVQAPGMYLIFEIDFQLE